MHNIEQKVSFSYPFWKSLMIWNSNQNITKKDLPKFINENPDYITLLVKSLTIAYANKEIAGGMEIYIRVLRLSLRLAITLNYSPNL